MNINLARKIASKSTHKIFNHVAIITAGRRILSVGYNRGEHHAEEIAIRRLSHINRNNGSIPRSLTITSLMFRKKTNSMGDSFPCYKCQARIAKAKIRWITYVERGMLRTI